MGHDHVGHEPRKLVDGRLFILVDVDDEMRGGELAYARDIDGFSAADLRDAAHERARMNAESRAADERRCETQVAQELGDAGHQRHDPRRRGHRVVARANGIDERVRRVILRW